MLIFLSLEPFLGHKDPFSPLDPCEALFGGQLVFTVEKSQLKALQQKSPAGDALCLLQGWLVRPHFCWLFLSFLKCVAPLACPEMIHFGLQNDKILVRGRGRSPPK